MTHESVSPESAQARGFAALPLDVAERAAGVAQGLRALGIPGDAGMAGEPEKRLLLDIGGAPGRIARALEERFPGVEIVVADLYECHFPRYVIADGARLPFADGAFDFAYSADTLEHVPAAGRADFLRELARVARKGIVIAAPFAHAEVEWAESALDAFHLEALGAPHPWLREHRERGLPSLEETAATLRAPGAGLRCLAPIPNGELNLWFLAQLAEILAQAVPVFTGPWRSLQFALARGSAWNGEENREVEAAEFAPYRWILCARRAPDERESAPAPPDARLFSRQRAAYDRARRRMEAFERFARDLLAEWRRLLGASGEGANAAQGELMRRLFAALELMESQTAAPAPQPGAATPSLSFPERLRRRLFSLSGDPPSPPPERKKDGEP